MHEPLRYFRFTNLVGAYKKYKPQYGEVLLLEVGYQNTSNKAVLWCSVQTKSSVPQIQIDHEIFP